MPSAELKTKKTKVSVTKYINAVEHPQRKKDAKVILQMMKEVTGEKPAMWGDSLIGFGHYHYKRKDGSEHEFFRIGFSPRKSNLTVYLMFGMKNHKDLLKKLGKHKMGSGCLYINKLDDVDLKVLKKMITVAYKEMKKLYPN